jgi:hypothetical protein
VNDIDFENRVAASRAFIQSCDLGDSLPAEYMKRSAMELTEEPRKEVDEQSTEAFVANDTIVSIVGGVSKKNRQIVKDCMLLASKAAARKYPEGGVEWFGFYTKVLSDLGWTPHSSSFSDYKASNSSFTMSQEGLTILQSAIAAAALPGPASVLMLSVAKEAITTLQASDKPLQLFNTSSKKHNGAKFAMGSVVEDEKNGLVVAMGVVDFNSSLNETNVLFWTWNSSSVSVKRAENYLTFNERHFASVADEVHKKLDASARKSLIDLEI